jgi:hypothetical protein
MEAELHAFLTSALDGDKWYALYSGCFAPGIRYPLDKKLVEPEIWSEPCGEDKNLLPLPKIKLRFLNRPALNLIAILTELSRFFLAKASLNKPMMNLSMCLN